MPIILKNNASSTLATAISASDTGIVVADGSKFPSLGASDYFYATLVSSNGTTEIIKVTARASNSMTVVRAQDGSSAASFASGALLEMRVNAASVTDLVDEHDQAAEISIADAGGYYTSTNVEGALQEVGGTKYPKSVSVLLADASLTYTAGGPNSVASGDIIRTRQEGFAYQVAASGATDQHVTTAGGVKLYLLPSADGTRNVMGLATDPDVAFATLFSGKWAVSEDITLSAGNTTIALDDFSLETQRDARITVGSGSNILTISGNRSGTGDLIRIYGGLAIGGTGSINRKADCFAGKIELETLGTNAGLSFAWGSNFKVTAPWDVLLSGTSAGNSGVTFVILKQPQMAGGTVRGNVSLGYSYIGNSTVAEPNIDGGYMGPMFTIKADSYTGVSAGNHGHYCKGCRNTVFEKIQSEGNGANTWSVNNYHIKLRDNLNCTFKEVTTIDTSDTYRGGRILFTSDGNTLAPCTENKNNTVSNIFGTMVIFQTAPGVTTENVFTNVYGFISASTAGSRNIVSGRIEFPDDTRTTVGNLYEFVDAEVIAPAFTVSACVFDRALIARRTKFHQKVKVLNQSITDMSHCYVNGDLDQDSTVGTYTVNLSHVTGTGRFFTNTVGTRVVTGNLQHCDFASAEPGATSQPTTKNYVCVSFGDKVYGATVEPFNIASYTVAALPTATAGAMAYASNGRKAGEGVGVGTGVLVFRDGSNWIAVDTGATVAA